MSTSAPDKPQSGPKYSVSFDGRDYPLLREDAGWRLRSKAKTHKADFRTRTHILLEAKRRAKEWLSKRAADPQFSRKGGGTLAALAKLYLATPKRTQERVGKNNVSRLRTVCMLALGKTLDVVTCREAGPELWQRYQKTAMEADGLDFNLTTRYRENIAINACVRAARSVFLPALLRVYRAAGLDVRDDASEAVMLPVPYVAPSDVNDAMLLDAWAQRPPWAPIDSWIWMTIGLARFAGLRREEIAAARIGWVEVDRGAVLISLRDRPEEKWWTKTGKPYRARVIHPEVAQALQSRLNEPADTPLVSDPPSCDRARWFRMMPQRWLRPFVPDGYKPLHRLRGLYADHIAAITSDAVTARLAGVEAARMNLGHTNAQTTERHYLTP